MTTTTGHWHVATGLAGYGPDAANSDGFATAHNVQSLAHLVAEECKRTADFEAEGAEALAESGDYKGAWFMLKNADELSTLALNLDYDKRAGAPLYREDRPALDATMVGLIEENFPFNFREGNSRIYVWQCTEPECIADEEEDPS